MSGVETGPWWRFTGIAGFKRYLPDRTIQHAIAKGYGWVRWYEPARADDPLHRLEFEVASYRSALEKIASWTPMQETGDVRLIQAFARASNNEIPDEWGANHRRLRASQETERG